ncbi:lipase [Corynebacterium phocae]|uniref:Lipase n=1 Tax=Corynebacterium phocae TaxID=161895 RepID=A0A1L7D6J1_9CORY|nr:lipase [Corynebacterium phocae]
MAGTYAEASDLAQAASLPLGARLKPRGIFEDFWDARPSAHSPWPVILLHGTTDAKGVWQLLGQELRAEGWAVFAPDYGHRATSPIAESVKQVASYIDAVMAVTGAEKVILIGHSQGGVVARAWLHGPGRGRVKHVICLGSPNHGTTQGGILSPLLAMRHQEYIMRSLIDSYFGPAGQEQVVGSPTLDRLNAEGDTIPGVSYTCIATKQDTVVVPPETCFLDPGDTGAEVDNLYVQDIERLAVVTHMDMPMDRRVRAIVRATLKRLAGQEG